jgi:hypothetical protein
VSLSRYEQLQRFRAWAEAQGVSLRDHLVVSPFLYVRMLLRGRPLRRVHLRSLPRGEVQRMYARARAILDLPNNVQSGYTMRTFEALGSHRKLITPNPNILHEDFYTADAVFVLGPQGDFPDPAFLRSAARFAAAIERYSLRTWLRRLLEPLLDRAGITTEPVRSRLRDTQ